jgi:hypothetical protein
MVRITAGYDQFRVWRPLSIRRPRSQSTIGVISSSIDALQIHSRAKGRRLSDRDCGPPDVPEGIRSSDIRGMLVAVRNGCRRRARFAVRRRDAAIDGGRGVIGLISGGPAPASRPSASPRWKLTPPRLPYRRRQYHLGDTDIRAISLDERRTAGPQDRLYRPERSGVINPAHDGQVCERLRCGIA